MDSTLRNKVGCSDIVQNALVKVVEHFEQFKGETSIEFRGWLKRIVVNEIHSTRRVFHAEKRDVARERPIDLTASRVSDQSPADVQLTPSSQALAKERMEKFHEVLEQLSPDHAEVIRLRNIQRLAFKEIAELMNRSEDAVSKLWYRAILNFEEKLKIATEF